VIARNVPVSGHANTPSWDTALLWETTSVAGHSLTQPDPAGNRLKLNGCMFDAHHPYTLLPAGVLPKLASLILWPCAWGM
jgi:hypothetical protein